MPDKNRPSELPRRFYAAVAVRAVAEGFAVCLDGRGLRTPAGLALVTPTESLARLLAEEWAAQDRYIIMTAMPATRLAFTTLDRIAGAREAVCAEVARFAGSDVLCYFAAFPRSLVVRQEEGWAPLLAWAEEELDIRLLRAVGIAHQAQPAESLLRVARRADQLGDFGLAGVAHATALFGSAILAFALERGRLSGEAALELSRLDEIFQAEQWGLDAEAAQRVESMRIEAVMLDRWFQALED